MKFRIVETLTQFRTWNPTAIVDCRKYENKSLLIYI